jgi:precorrin-6B methylase 2
MRKAVRRVLYRFLPARLLLPLLLVLEGSSAGVASAWGYARSVRLMRPVDRQDRPLPFLPYCVIDLLAERLRPGMAVLEFGSGYSTLFFMTRVARVTSVEHHQDWLRTLRGRVAANVTLLAVAHASASEYTAPVRAGADRFDLVLVDGRHRTDCFALALERLTAGGVIVLDDSDRAEYAPAFEWAARSGFRVLHLRGHKPTDLGVHRSSIFYRDGNCLGI